MEQKTSLLFTTMNHTGISTHRLGESLLELASVNSNSDVSGERRKIVLDKHGFRYCRDGKGAEITRFFKSGVKGDSGVGKNQKAWKAAAISIGSSRLLKKYMEQGRELTLRRLNKVLSSSTVSEINADFDMHAFKVQLSTRGEIRFGQAMDKEMLS